MTKQLTILQNPRYKVGQNVVCMASGDIKTAYIIKAKRGLTISMYLIRYMRDDSDFFQWIGENSIYEAL